MECNIPDTISDTDLCERFVASLACELTGHRQFANRTEATIPFYNKSSTSTTPGDESLPSMTCHPYITK